MSSTPVGPGGPSSVTPMNGADATSQSENALGFRQDDQGSSVSQLLRGKIGQMRDMQLPTLDTSFALNFRELVTPSAVAQQIVGRLQTGT